MGENVKDQVLSKFCLIVHDEKKGTGSIEYNALQEKVTRIRQNIWGKKVKREVMFSISPEKAAADYLNSKPIYVQKFILLLDPPSGAANGLKTPALVRMGSPFLVSNDQELEEISKKAAFAA